MEIIKAQTAPPMRGFTSKGYIQDAQINHGEPLPLYAMNGGINTLEGWNAMRHADAARALLRKLGRAPSEDEIQMEMQRNAELARQLIEKTRCAP